MKTTVNYMYGQKKKSIVFDSKQSAMNWMKYARQDKDDPIKKIWIKKMKR